jgi:hypothetical protein
MLQHDLFWPELEIFFFDSQPQAGSESVDGFREHLSKEVPQPTLTTSAEPLGATPF